MTAQKIRRRASKELTEEGIFPPDLFKVEVNFQPLFQVKPGGKNARATPKEIAL
jgi:hypothetical protein